MNRKISYSILVGMILVLSSSLLSLASAQIIAINPDEGPAGTAITISGTDFPVNTQVTIAFPPSWNLAAIHVNTDGDGKFQTDTTIPEGIAAGTYTITANARDSSHSEFTITVSIVVPEYALAALGALGACLAGFIVFNKRNSILHFKR